MPHNKHDLTGQTFGRLTVLEEAGRNKAGHTLWRCHCSCGNERTAVAHSLRIGRTTSCGCGRRLDLIGQRFGLLTVIEGAGVSRQNTTWRCKCDCGGESVVIGNDLKRGNVTSCGCIGWVGKSTHGQHDTPLYGRWTGMIGRTTNPNDHRYADYGGRGITVCQRWRKFENFAADMGPTFREELTLERVDVNGPYSPENCVWETMAAQNRNKRNNRSVTFRGTTRLLVEWCELLGLNYNTVRMRLDKHGWSAERALTTGADPQALARLNSD